MAGRDGNLRFHGVLLRDKVHSDEIHKLLDSGLLAFCIKQWFSTPGRDPQRGREPFWCGHEYIIYVHSCITFALFEFYMGVVRL